MYLYWVEVQRRFLVRSVVKRQGHSPNVSEQCIVAFDRHAALGNKRAESFELAFAQCGLTVGPAVIKAERVHLLVPLPIVLGLICRVFGDSVTAEELETLRIGPVVCHNNPT